MNKPIKIRWREGSENADVGFSDQNYRLKRRFKNKIKKALTDYLCIGIIRFMRYSSTASTIMDVAEELIQTQGCNAFSYRDLSKRIGIKTSSIHYHFNTKNDLVKAVTNRYHEAYLEQLDGLKNERSATKKLMTYASLFAKTFRRGRRICLCASLASDLEALPDDICGIISQFIAVQEKWLADLVRQGIETGEFRQVDDIDQAARNIFYTLQGAMLMARASAVEHIEDAGNWVLTLLKQD